MGKRPCRVVELLREQGLTIPVVVGGIIPERDVPVLEEAGVAAILAPGASSAEVVATMETWWPAADCSSARRVTDRDGPPVIACRESTMWRIRIPGKCAGQNIGGLGVGERGAGRAAQAPGQVAVGHPGVDRPGTGPDHDASHAGESRQQPRPEGVRRRAGPRSR